MAGKNADNIGHQSGGWTISWQGGSGATTPGTTILQGIRNTVAPSTVVTYNQTGAGINNTYNVAIAVVGETPYAEGAGDRPGSMSLDTTDINTINTLRGAGVPVVVVLVSGRPMDIASQLPNWNALVAAWLPGTEGQGVADVLFGVAQPTGKLPMTWMNSVSQQPINTGDGQTPAVPVRLRADLRGPPPTRDAYAVTQAESYSSQSGTQVETTSDTGGGQNVGFIAPGDWLAYANVDFGTPTATTVTTRRASGATATGTIQYRLDSTTGPIIASVPISNTGGWQSWGSVTTNLSGSATGVHTVFITFTGSGGDFVNLNWFQFARAGATRNPYVVNQAESYSSQSGTQLETTSDTGGGQNVGLIAPGDWLAYANVDFGTPTALTVTTRRASGSTATGTIQYRLDSTTGPIIASVPISNTGGWQSWGSVTTTLSGSATGVHTLYITFTGSGGDFVNINWFQFAR